MFLWTLLLVVLLTAGAYVAGRQRAIALQAAAGSRLHSLPSYHGYLLAAAALLALAAAQAQAAFLVNGSLENTGGTWSDAFPGSSPRVT